MSETQIRSRLRSLARQLAYEDAAEARALGARLAQVAAYPGPLRSIYVRRRVDLFDVHWAARRQRELAQTLETWLADAPADCAPALRAHSEAARQAHDALAALFLLAWAES